MDKSNLRTLKEVALYLGKPAHRIIHLCEVGVVNPTVDAEGRGSVRRFSRDDMFRARLGLELQDAGIQVPSMKPVMAALDRFMELKEVKEFKHKLGHFDLVSVIQHIGSDKDPLLAWLTPPDQVVLITPKFSVPSRPDVRVNLQMTSEGLLWRGVSIVINLTSTASCL